MTGRQRTGQGAIGNREYRIALALLGLFLGFHSVVQAQAALTFGLIVEGKLTVGLLDRPPQVLDRSEIAMLTRTTLKVKEPGRKSSTYSGVLVRDLLIHVG